METVTNWIAWHQDDMILTAVCAVIWACVHELVKVGIKKALGMPYKK